MRRSHFLLNLLILVSLVFTSTATAASLSKKEAGYLTGFVRWQASNGDFANWTLEGVSSASDALVLVPGTASSGTDPYPADGYYGGNFYNAGNFLVGAATSPEILADFNFTEAIASWNADTPEGTWIEILIRAQFGARWSKWYNLGIWAATPGTIQRHSVRLQGDSDGYVATDTLVISNKKVPANAFQLRARLFSVDGSAVPSIRNLSVAYSTTPPQKVLNLSTGDPTLWNTLLTVPECSQMVYPDGGNVWCSPTSTSMVLGYWGYLPGPCEQRVRATVEGVYDWIYAGHGNWPFNTAYAASYGLEAYVARFTSLDKAEEWISAGVPVVMSIAWGKKDLTYAPVTSSAGHLVVLVGFDNNGNPIVNDPAAATDIDVQRTYIRTELETVWLQNSGGTVYLIYPQGQPVPDL